MLFLKIVSHHKGSDTNIAHPVWSLRLYSGSYRVLFAVPVTVDSVLASPPMSTL